MRTLRDRRVLLGLFAFALFGLGASLGERATASPPNPTARSVSDAEAQLIIGHSLPDLTVRPNGIRRVGVSANPLGLPQDQIVISYAIANRNVVELSVFKAPNISRIDPTGIEKMTLGGTPMDVSSRLVDRPDHHWTFVTYTWRRETLSFALTVHLLEGLSRQDADAIAASVR